MKKIALVGVIALAVALAAPLASEARGGYSHRGHGHHHHRHFVGSRVFVGFGPAVYWGYPYWYYPPPVVYAPPRVVVQEPPVYVQQQQPVATPAPVPAPEQYWYYCESSKGYYPTVPSCPEQWIKVAPR